MFKISILLLSAILSLAPQVGAENISQLRQIENALSGQLVDVVYILKYDALGNVPSAAGLFCVNCNDFHDRNLGELLANHRNLQVTGVMVAENLVLTGDLFIDPQGIEKLEVRFKNNTIPAAIKTVYPDQGALLLELARPLPGTRTTLCNPELPGKLFAYSRIMENGRWISRLRPFRAPQEEQLCSPDRNSCSIPGNSLIVNARGEVAAIMTNTNETVAPITWNLPWTQWRGISGKDFLQRKKQLKDHLQKAILP